MHIKVWTFICSIAKWYNILKLNCQFKIILRLLSVQLHYPTNLNGTTLYFIRVNYVSYTLSLTRFRAATNRFVNFCFLHKLRISYTRLLQFLLGEVRYIATPLTLTLHYRKKNIACASQTTWVDISLNTSVQCSWSGVKH